MCYPPTACFACLMLDGEFYPIDAEPCDHPNGKCSFVPVTKHFDPINDPSWERGQDWFARQDEETQRRIMGPGRFDLWKQQGVDPRSMVYIKPNKIWGGSPAIRTLEELRNKLFNLKSFGTAPNLAVEERAWLFRNNPNTVPLQALDAPGFTEKFKDITGNEETDEAIYNSAVEILTHRNGTDREDLYLIDIDSSEVFHKHIRSSSDKGIDYDDEIKQAIADARKAGRRIVAIHNHPNGLPPTLDDGSTAFYRGYDLGIAVGHNLEVWTYGKANKAYNKNDCDAVHDALNEKILYLPQFDEEEWYNALIEFGMEVKRL